MIPKELKLFIYSVIAQLICKPGYSTFFSGIWKIIPLVLLTFRESFFILSQSLIFVSSSFTLLFKLPDRLKIVNVLVTVVSSA